MPRMRRGEPRQPTRPMPSSFQGAGTVGVAVAAPRVEMHALAVGVGIGVVGGRLVCGTPRWLVLPDPGHRPPRRRHRPVLLGA